MKKSWSSGSWSSVNWENSYYGGYQRVLWDHPSIKVDFDIDFKHRDAPLPGDEVLSYGSRNKLCELFLLKVQQSPILKAWFIKDGKIVTRKAYWMTKQYFIPNPMHVGTCIRELMSDPELGNMFSHYGDFLSNVEFTIEVKKNKDGSTPSPGKFDPYGDKEDEDKDGEGSGDNDGDEGDNKKEEKSYKPTSAQLSEVGGKVDATKIMVYTYFASGTGAVSGDLKAKTVFRIVPTNSNPTAYTAKETLQAQQLFNMLDISFDPDKDVVPNLRTGKLTPGKISEVLAGNMHIYHKMEEHMTTKPFSVCILADESGSMSGHGSGPQQSLMKVLYKCFTQLMPPNKLYIFGHTGDHTPDIYVYNDAYNTNFEYSIDNQMDHRWVQNYDGPAMECVYERVRSQTSDNIIFITISDGLPEGYAYGGQKAIEDMKRVIEKCKRDGFVTVGVGINLDQVRDIYPYHTVITNLSNLAKNVSTVVNRVVKGEFQDL